MLISFHILWPGSFPLSAQESIQSSGVLSENVIEYDISLSFHDDWYRVFLLLENSQCINETYISELLLCMARALTSDRSRTLFCNADGDCGMHSGT